MLCSPNVSAPAPTSSALGPPPAAERPSAATPPEAIVEAPVANADAAAALAAPLLCLLVRLRGGMGDDDESEDGEDVQQASQQYGDETEIAEQFFGTQAFGDDEYEEEGQGPSLL